MIYANEIVIRQTAKVGDKQLETEVAIYLNDQQPDIDPDDLKQIVKSTIEGIDRTP